MTLSRRGAAIALAALTAVAVATATILFSGQVFGGAREVSPGVWDQASLPERLQVCGRSYRHDALNRIRTASEVEEVSGVPPTVVQPLQEQPCIPGPCDDVADPLPCDVVVYVRVGGDEYIDYSLQGGP